MATFLENVFGLGDSSWQDRLRGKIGLVSPRFQVFTANWRGSPRTVKKKLGIFTFPNSPGSIVQDLDVEADSYPMTIFFEGDANDLDAGRFFLACKEVGTWKVLHPIHGPLELHLVSATEKDEPVESGNITAFDLNWIEAAPDENGFSLSLIGSVIQTVGSLINQAMGLYALLTTKQEKFTHTQAIRNSIAEFQKSTTKNLQPIYTQDAQIQATVEAIILAIDSTISDSVIEVDVLSGQMQQLLLTTILALPETTGLIPGLNSLLVFVNELILTAPTSGGVDNKNYAINLETSLSAAINAASQLVVNSTLRSKNEALQAFNIYTDIVDNSINALENVQTFFNEDFVEDQYISLQELFSRLNEITTNTANFLIVSSFDLATERRFPLKKQRMPVEIVATEFGEMGEDDENLDFFIADNDLKGDEIILLPIGKEVVINAQAQ